MDHSILASYSIFWFHTFLSFKLLSKIIDSQVHLLVEGTGISRNRLDCYLLKFAAIISFTRLTC